MQSGVEEGRRNVMDSPGWTAESSHDPDPEKIKQKRLDELRREVAIGIEEADRGELYPLDIEAIKAEGRRRLAQERK